MKVLSALLVTLLPVITFAQEGAYDPPPPQQDPSYGQQQQDPAYAQQQGYPVEQQPVQDVPHYGFYGPHPEPYDAGGQQICYEQGAHFHAYAPFDQYLFREANGYFYFVGDFGDFGYSGQMWGYQGNHPVPLEWGGGFCYIGWPHRHHYPAPSSMAFSYVGGYYAYTGVWDPAYYVNRDAWYGYYNGYYRNSYYGGRYWSVRPAAIYRPAWGYGTRGVYRPGVTVAAPGGGRVSVVGVGRGYGASYARPGYAQPGHPAYAQPGYARPAYVAPAAHPAYAAPAPRPAYAAPAPAPHPTYAAPAVQRRPAAAPAGSLPHKRGF